MCRTWNRLLQKEKKKTERAIVDENESLMAWAQANGLLESGWHLTADLFSQAFSSDNASMLDRLWNLDLRFRIQDLSDLLMAAFENDAVSSVKWAWRTVPDPENFEDFCTWVFEDSDRPKIEEWFRAIGMAEKIEADETIKCIRKLFGDEKSEKIRFP